MAGVLEGMMAQMATAKPRRQLSKQQREARSRRDAILAGLGIAERDVRKLDAPTIKRLHEAGGFSSDAPPAAQAARATGGMVPVPTTTGTSLADTLTVAPQTQAKPMQHDRRRGPNLSPAELDLLFRAALKGAANVRPTGIQDRRTY